MRVKIEERPGMPMFGEFVGLLVDDRVSDQTDICAVVRVDGYGLYLKVLHPSKVTFVTPEEEALHRP